MTGIAYIKQTTRLETQLHGPSRASSTPVDTRFSAQGDTVIGDPALFGLEVFNTSVIPVKSCQTMHLSGFHSLYILLQVLHPSFPLL